MANKSGIYRRGPYWLDYEQRNGHPVSKSLYIFWYDQAAGKIRRKSTREDDVRLATEALDRHYLAASKPEAEDSTAYSVQDAMSDYWLEKGSKQASAEAIKSRLKLFNRFLEVEIKAGRLGEPILAMGLDNKLLDRFREWATTEDQIATRKRDANGDWTFSYRPRSLSTAEESIIQLKAALNHGKDRIGSVPSLTHKARNAVTQQRDYRLSIDDLAKLLDYTAEGSGKYAGHADRLLPLRRYLVASISTIARPDAIFDMSVAPARGQWMKGYNIFNLNPNGRTPTKKRRPVLPVTPVLNEWLIATEEWFVCKEWDEEITGGDLQAHQKRVMSVDSGWSSACEKFGIPPGWGPKLIRHSVATILAAKRVDIVELEIALGHRPLKETTSRYIIFDPDYLLSFRQGVEELWSDLGKRCTHPIHPNFTQEQRRKRQAERRKAKESV